MGLLSIKDLGNPESEKLLRTLSRISQKYDEFLIEDVEDPSIRHPGLHASEISTCALKACLTILNTEKRPVNHHSKWKKRLDHGKLIHEMIQNNFLRMAAKTEGLIHFEPEAPITPTTSPVSARHNIYSSCDGIFTFYKKDADGVPTQVARMGLEIKSSSPSEFDKLRKKPRKEHVEQCHVYMACLDLPAIYLMYYSKGNELVTPSTGEFLLTFNKYLWDSLEQRFDGWYDLLEAGKLPERTETIVCEFCPYSWKCDPKILKRYANKKKSTYRITGIRR